MQGAFTSEKVKSILEKSGGIAIGGKVCFMSKFDALGD